MNKLTTLLRKDFLEQWRSKKVMILTFLFLFVAIGSPVLAKAVPLLLKSVPSTPGLVINLPDPTYMDAIDQFVKNISQIAILVLIFVVSGAVVDEKSRKNLEILLTKPISRTNFILSKFVSYFGSIAGVFAASSLVFYFYTVSTFASFNAANFAIAAAFILLYVLMICAITILASTVTRNSVSAAGLGFLGYILFGTVFGLVKQITKYSPDYIFSHYKDLITNGWNNHFIIPALVALFVIFLAVTAAVLIFQKQEVER